MEIKQEFQDNKVAHLLWTGGWDSTFRLLTLLIEQRKKTQPYYIIDSGRGSLRMEILTMQRIKERVLLEHPDVRSLFLPTIFREVSDIPPCESISASYQRLNIEKPLGIQYDWLARFAHAENIGELEIGCEKTMDDWIEPYLVQHSNNQDPYYKIDTKHEGSNFFDVFKYFKFPLQGLTKVDMQIISKNKGFEELMNLTWFCHRPSRNGKPCGVCNPCEQAMKHGHAWRLPYRSRCRYHVRQPFKKGKRLLQTKYPKVYRSAQWVKHNIFRLST